MSNDSLVMVTIQLQSTDAWKNCAGDDKNYSIINRFDPLHMLTIKAKASFIKKIINCNAVLFTDDVKKPKEELLLGFVDYSFNNISLLQSEYPQYNGNNLFVSIKENRFDTTDIDFKNRIVPSAFASPIFNSHASAMATITAGGGNTWNYTKGAGWNAKLSSASFSNLLPEPLSYYQQPNIYLQNHSYGTIVEHFYGAEAAAYDASVTSIPSLVHVFSVGNSGLINPTSGRYAGIPATANITGNFKQSKNTISVGHADSFYTVLPPSSRGPAFDGRIKPELVAFGEDGSSGAAALVSGIALALQHAHQQLYGTIPTASLIKTILLNSADDVGAHGIDFASGYGNANGYKAMQTIINGRFFNGSVAANSTQTFNINIPSGIQQLKLTLSWTDLAAAPGTSKALINDLDLELKQNNNAQVWQPWVLNSFPHKDSLLQLPKQKRDTLNNSEQISINNPQPGAYTITVKANSLANTAQNFSVAWQVDSVEKFKWYYPSKNDHLLPPDSNVLRWQTTLDGTGTLQISTDDGSSWQTIGTNVNLAKGFFKYAPPNVYKKAVLRMQTGAAMHVSDTFTISKRPSVNVGFNCTDSVLLTWQKIPGINQYRVLQLGNQFMQPLMLTNDTFFLISKTSNNSLHYAIEPVFQSKALVRSYTFNYELQGVGCYIRTLLADLTAANQGLLKLELSTSVRVQSVVFEKRKANGFEVIHTASAAGNALQYTFTDINLNKGRNVYRAAVILSDGRKFYSDETAFLFNGNEKAIVYPNPVVRTQPLNILANLEDELMFELINSTGHIVLQQIINDVPELVNIQHLSKGIYYYRILSKSKQKVKSGAIVIN
ncbi:MAG: S8 family peptidase [Chitinophagaceae bacterium]